MNYCPHFLNIREHEEMSVHTELMETKENGVRLSFYKYKQIFCTVI